MPDAVSQEALELLQRLRQGQALDFTPPPSSPPPRVVDDETPALRRRIAALEAELAHERARHAETHQLLRRALRGTEGSGASPEPHAAAVRVPPAVHVASQLLQRHDPDAAPPATSVDTVRRLWAGVDSALRPTTPSRTATPKRSGGRPASVAFGSGTSRFQHGVALDGHHGTYAAARVAPRKTPRGARHGGATLTAPSAAAWDVADR